MLALSLRQPWAALLISGRKSIEIRKWTTPVRGRVLIHASKIPDPRAEAWAWLDPASARFIHLYGGIVGEADLVEVVHYSSVEPFHEQISAHLNYPEWFRDTGLYGFVFARPRELPFRPYKGDVKFFEVWESSE